MQSESQHTPSTQWPFWHSADVPQAEPFGSLLVQMPPEQYWFEPLQGVVAQSPLQTVPPWTQPNTSQSWSSGGEHEPLPWQVPWSVATPFAQLASRHVTVPSG